MKMIKKKERSNVGWTMSSSRESGTVQLYCSNRTNKHSHKINMRKGSEREREREREREGETEKE